MGLLKASSCARGVGMREPHSRPAHYLLWSVGTTQVVRRAGYFAGTAKDLTQEGKVDVWAEAQSAKGTTLSKLTWSIGL